MVVAIMAALAVAVVGASSASAALPQFKPNSAFPIKYTTSGGTSRFTVGNNGEIAQMQCSHLTSTGQIANAKEVNKVVQTLKECKLAGFIGGGQIAEITSAPLKGHLGYINKSKKEVGLELEPETGEVWLEFTGSTLTVQKGHLIGKITPVNISTNEPKVTYEETSLFSGVQKIQGFEGGPTEQHLTWTWPGVPATEQVGIEYTDPWKTTTGTTVEVQG